MYTLFFTEIFTFALLDLKCLADSSSSDHTGQINTTACEACTHDFHSQALAPVYQ